jgi:hypothetical protein
MVSYLFFSQLALIAFVWLFVMLLYVWPSARVRRSTPAAPLMPRRRHTTEPKPFAGLTTKPYGALWEQEFLNVAPTEPWSPCKPHKVRLPRHQTSARAWRSSSV